MGVENLELLLKKSKSLKVLYVEDDAASRDSTLQALQIFFEDIIVANDGEEGYETFVESSFDLIITDINMPILNGIDMIYKIRQIDTEVTVLILSADVSAESFTKTIRAGIEGYLLKPIDIEQFISLIKKSVDNILSKKEIEDYKINLEEKVQEQTLKIKESLFRDNTTGLYNFLKLNEDINSGIYKSLLLFEIDQFSIMTMQYGREVTNKLLIEVSKTLQNNMSLDKQVYKLESDKFAILSKDNNQEKIEDFCKQILAYYDMSSMNVNGIEIYVTLSIGITLIDKNIDSTINVEYALENAKKTGGRYYSFYDTSNDEIIEEQKNIMMMNTVKELICDEDIVPYYEAILDVSTDEIIRYDVSVRGLIENELVKPSFFMNTAKRLGLISSVTKIIIQKSFQFFANNNYDFSIKITHRDLLEGYLPNFLAQKIKLYNIDASRITLEILENISISFDGKVIDNNIEAIKKMGVNIVIYDLGIENSNITKLVDIHLDLIKIDGHLINDMIKNEKARLIVKHISSLAKTLEIKVVAEHIDTKEILDIAKEIGIDYAQGSYVGQVLEDDI